MNKTESAEAMKAYLAARRVEREAVDLYWDSEIIPHAELDSVGQPVFNDALLQMSLILCFKRLLYEAHHGDVNAAIFLVKQFAQPPEADLHARLAAMTDADLEADMIRSLMEEGGFPEPEAREIVQRAAKGDLSGVARARERLRALEEGEE